MDIRPSIITWLAGLVDDGLYRPSDDPLIAALNDPHQRPAHTESRLILAGFDVVGCFDHRDWQILHARLQALDELSQ